MSLGETTILFKIWSKVLCCYNPFFVSCVFAGTAQLRSVVPWRITAISPSLRCQNLYHCNLINKSGQTDIMSFHQYWPGLFKQVIENCSWASIVHQTIFSLLCYHPSCKWWWLETTLRVESRIAESRLSIYLRNTFFSLNSEQLNIIIYALFHTLPHNESYFSFFPPPDGASHFMYGHGRAVTMTMILRWVQVLPCSGSFRCQYLTPGGSWHLAWLLLKVESLFALTVSSSCCHHMAILT